MTSVRRCIGLAALVAMWGCSAQGGGISPGRDAIPQIRRASAAPLSKYIKHVVIIIQENRSFENMFAGWPGADAPMFGYIAGSNGAETKVNLQPVAFIKRDMGHQWADGVTGWDNGKMDKFNVEFIEGGGEAGTFPYSYLEHSEIAPYRAMARQYVLADHMFPTMFGPSFTAHLDLVASSTNLTPGLAEVNIPQGTPWGCEAPAGTTTSLLTTKRVVLNAGGPFPCFTRINTMADTLDAAHVSWKYYAPTVAQQAWSAFDAIRSVREGPDWTKNVISPQTTVLTDAAAGNLPSVSWVTPDAMDSDHPGDGSDQGPSWVASVVNAVGKGPDWKSTAIVVVWDDWGGWFDNVPPPQKDFVGLGIRVPCMIISPYAKQNYVSHTVYEFGSILKFAEEAFDLPALGTTADGYTDTRATSIVDSFDFTQQPRKFVRIPQKYPTEFFLKETPSGMPPDNE
jgi:phospholipase C